MLLTEASLSLRSPTTSISSTFSENSTPPARRSVSSPASLPWIVVKSDGCSVICTGVPWWITRRVSVISRASSVVRTVRPNSSKDRGKEQVRVGLCAIHRYTGKSKSGCWLFMRYAVSTKTIITNARRSSSIHSGTFPHREQGELRERTKQEHKDGRPTNFNNCRTCNVKPTSGFISLFILDNYFLFRVTVLS